MRASGQSDLHKLEALSLGTLADVASYLHRLFFLEENTVFPLQVYVKFMLLCCLHWYFTQSPGADWMRRLASSPYAAPKGVVSRGGPFAWHPYKSHHIISHRWNLTRFGGLMHDMIAPASC